MHVTFPNGKKRVELTATEHKKCNNARQLMQALAEVGVQHAAEAAQSISDAMAEFVKNDTPAK